MWQNREMKITFDQTKHLPAAALEAAQMRVILAGDIDAAIAEATADPGIDPAEMVFLRAMRHDPVPKPRRRRA